MTTTKTGQTGENQAIIYLKKQNFTILNRNFHTKYGEIDIVASKNKRLYFFEVKYRRTMNFGFGEGAISPNKIMKLTKSIEVWISKNTLYNYNEIYLNALIIDNDNKIHEYIIL